MNYLDILANFKRTLKRVSLTFWSFLNNGVEVSSRLKSLLTVFDLERESNESQKAFYFLSFMLIISLVVLSPDKIPQMLNSAATEGGSLDLLKEAAQIARRIISNIN